MRTRVIAATVALYAACDGATRQPPPAKVAGVRVVDVIPVSLSGETWQDAEPFLALYASNAQLMAASAFTPNPGGSASGTAPIFVSSDGGDTWTLRNTLPSEGMTADITHAVGATPPVLYSGILKVPGVPLNELKAGDFLSPATMTLQASRADVDQPFVRTAKPRAPIACTSASMISTHPTGAPPPWTCRSTAARPTSHVASKPAPLWGRTVRPYVPPSPRTAPYTSPTSGGARPRDRP